MGEDGRRGVAGAADELEADEERLSIGAESRSSLIASRVSLPSSSRFLVAPPVAAVGLCNGIPLRGAYSNVGTLFGGRVQEQLLEHVPEELGEALRYGRIVVGGWYPLSWLAAIHQAAQELTGSGRELSRKLGYIGAKSYFRGVHKVFIGFMNPGFVIGKSPTVFRKYYNTGDMRVVTHSDGHCVVEWSGCTGFNAQLWQGVFGACEAVLELSGAKNIRLRGVSGGGDGDDHASAGAYWT